MKVSTLKNIPDLPVEGADVLVTFPTGSEPDPERRTDAALAPVNRTSSLASSSSRSFSGGSTGLPSLRLARSTARKRRAPICQLPF